MRRFLLVAAIVATATATQAADMPDFLRGSFTAPVAARTNWQGVYLGGQASYGAADMDFTNSGQDLLAKLLNNIDVEQEFNISKWPLQQKTSTQNNGFGGFFGYNAQWTDVVVGVELNYIHGKFFNSSSGSQGRTFFFPTDYQTTANVSSSSSMLIRDYGSLRVRGGYVWGCFLPYLFGGVALGQADINRVASYDIKYKYVGTQVPALPDLPSTGSFTDSLPDTANAHFIYGYSGGLGVDMMLFANLFVRAEWEYMRFTAPVDTTINTVRAGIGYKF
ncbi:MAG: outer rane immunogenic protein [Bradyrhizobium sp.]|jgi:opacity protein-like surface antigen|nr:outer rane immunogenic protein [Bradyrhizobium sp.]